MRSLIVALLHLSRGVRPTHTRRMLEIRCRRVLAAAIRRPYIARVTNWVHDLVGGIFNLGSGRRGRSRA